MKIELKRTPVTEKKASDFLYISCDNYEIVDVTTSCFPWKYLYCDSATSSIILIISGYDSMYHKTVAICSLSDSSKLSAFAAIIEGSFKGKLSVFAYVSNPPQHGTDTSRKADSIATKNLNTISSWVSQYSLKNDIQQKRSNFIVEKATLLLGETNSLIYSEDMDCYGIDISSEIPVVNNRRFHLSLKDRDPSGGLQSLFCAFGSQLYSPLLLVRASAIFDPYDNSSLTSNQHLLVDIAHNNNYEKYESMSDDEILEECSTIPYLESPWFCDTIREASSFVRMNYHLMKNAAMDGALYPFKSAISL